jgi:hypothetical protein
MTVFRGLFRLALLSGVSIGVAIGMDSQEPIPGVPRSKPVNLQVLPKEMSAASVGKLMKRFEQDLGVKCSHCHVEDPHTLKVDYVSDENPRKQTARVMISMLADINDKYLAQLGADRRYAVPVTCGSCHQGQSSPPEFDR